MARRAPRAPRKGKRWCGENELRVMLTQGGKEELPPGEHLIETEIADEAGVAASTVHAGPGSALRESVEEGVLAHELEELIVGEKAIAEPEAVEAAIPADKRKVPTCLNPPDVKPGLLIDFGVVMSNEGIARVVHGLPEEGNFAVRGGPCSFTFPIFLLFWLRPSRPPDRTTGNNLPVVQAGLYVSIVNG